MITFVLGSDWKAASAFVRARLGAYERAHDGAVALRVDAREDDDDVVWGAFSSQQLWGSEQFVVFSHADARAELLAHINEHAQRLSEVGDIYVVWCECAKKDVQTYGNILRYSEVHEFMLANVGEVPQQEVYAFSDLVASGKGAQSLLKLEQLKRRGVPEERLFNGVKAHAENLAIIGALLKQGRSVGDIVSSTKLHPYVVEKCMTQLRARPANQRLNEALLRFDMELKRGMVEYPEGFEEVLLS